MMHTIAIDDRTLDDLLFLIESEIIRTGAQIRRPRVFASQIRRDENAAKFARMVSLMHALRETDPTAIPAAPARAFFDSAEMQNDMITRAEGIDPEKELGAYDPRASNPVCVHNRRFNEACPLCAGTAPIKGVNPA